MKTSCIIRDRYKISGYESDYVFQSIKETSDFYESAILNKWLPYIENSKYIFDIGANLGNHTLFFAENTKSEKIYAFEPFVPNYKILVENIFNNSLSSVHAINAAVGARDGFVELKQFDEANYGGTSFVENKNSEGTDIRLMSVDTFAIENNIDAIDFMKIDTEGFEVDVLHGMQKCIERFLPDFWIEVSAESFLEVIELLESFGYVLVDVDGFNMLFLHESKHENLNKYEYKTALKDMFHHLERVNAYYKNYQTAKKWLANKDEQNQKLLEEQQKLKEKYSATLQQISDKNTLYQTLQSEQQTLNEKYKQSLDNYAVVKQWLSDKNEQNQKLLEEQQILRNKYNVILQQLDDKKTQCQKLQSEYEQLQRTYDIERVELQESMKQIYLDYDLTVSILEEVNRKIQTLEVQNGYLKKENQEYRRKLSIITDSWWGKLGIKVYKKLKKWNIM